MGGAVLYRADFSTPVIQGLWGLVASDFLLHVGVGKIDRDRRLGVDRHSVVVASISELATLPGQPLDFPVIGSAAMSIRNIAPRDDGLVDMWVHIDWFEVLTCRISLAVFNS